MAPPRSSARFVARMVKGAKPGTMSGFIEPALAVDFVPRTMRQLRTMTDHRPPSNDGKMELLFGVGASSDIWMIRCSGLVRFMHLFYLLAWDRWQIAYFFDDTASLKADEMTRLVKRFSAMSDGRALAAAYQKLSNPKLRARVVSLVRAYADC